MNDTDFESAETLEVLGVLRGALDDVAMETPVERIVAAGRARRRKRFAVTAAGAAAVAALGVGLPQLAAHPATAPPGAAPLHTQEAAFTVTALAHGTVNVTWTKEGYFADPQGLERALRRAGFPVQVRMGTFCHGPQDTGTVDAHGSGAGVDRVMTATRDAAGHVVFTFHASALPAGQELFIGYLNQQQLAVTQGHPGSVERLVPRNTTLVCSSDWRG